VFAMTARRGSDLPVREWPAALRTLQDLLLYVARSAVDPSSSLPAVDIFEVPLPAQLRDYLF
jgi:hypothetical protein